MSQTATLAGPTSRLAALGHIFEFGPGVDRLGITDAAHAATWHMAGLIESLRALHADRVEELQRSAVSARPALPDEEPTA